MKMNKVLTLIVFSFMATSCAQLSQQRNKGKQLRGPLLPDVEASLQTRKLPLTERRSILMQRCIDRFIQQGVSFNDVSVVCDERVFKNILNVTPASSVLTPEAGGE
jgi:hypothetical protein